jgi:hypothetical protein
MALLHRSALALTLLLAGTAAHGAGNPGGVVANASLPGQGAITTVDRAAPISSLPNQPWGNPPPARVHPITGIRSPLPKDWIGLRAVPADIPILVMAGHADSQGIDGAGTSGEAVSLMGAEPMVRSITDELYWNLLVSQAVVQLGRQRGLSIHHYRPPALTIRDSDHPATNWTVGRRHMERGGYSLEIHFDAYGPSGIGSGLIPAMRQAFSRLDESLATEFGAYPMGFRNVLGGPRRGISLLEIGKLEGTLEARLRDPRTRQATVLAIATRVVDALERGLGGAVPAGPPAQTGSR